MMALGGFVLAAQQAAEAPSMPPGVSDLAPGEPDQGVALSLDLLTQGTRSSGESCRKFEALEDLILDLRLQTVGDGVKRIVMESGEWGHLALALLFELEITAADGTPLALPTFWLGIDFFPDERTSRHLFDFAHVEELGPQEVTMRQVKLADWPGWGGIDLAPGSYRMRAVYRGAPPPPQPPPPPLQVDEHYRHVTTGTWRGEARSQELRFEITGDERPLDWSEPQRGLRVASRVRTSSRFLLGDTVRPRFVVENVSDETLQFVRDLPASQEDERTIVHPTLGERRQDLTLGTGWSPRVTWRLPPKSRVWIDAAPIRTSAEQFPTPATYSIRQRLCLRDGVVPPLETRQRIEAELAAAHVRRWSDWLGTKHFEIELLARE
jgi:hypothetical protein